MKSTGHVIVRQLKLAEVPKMITVWKRAGLPFRPAGRDSLASLRSQARCSPDLFMGAFIEDELVGAVLGSDDGRRGWINRLAVVPEARGFGIGGRLVKACEKALRRRGRKLFCTTIEGSNEASMSLFEELGYKQEHGIVYLTNRRDKSY